MTAAPNRTPAGSPDGGKFATGATAAEAATVLVNEPAMFSLDGSPDVRLHTRAAPGPAWNGIPVPRATPAELKKFVHDLNAHRGQQLMAVTVGTDVETGEVAVALVQVCNDRGTCTDDHTAAGGHVGNEDDEQRIWELANMNDTIDLDGLNWNDVDPAGLCSECSASLDDGEGYGGLCGSCADLADIQG